MVMDAAFRLWAKLSSGGDRCTYHPLIYHMIDVANVTTELWENAFTANVRSMICAALVCDEESAIQTLSFWAGLHDVGKACPGFQLQDTPLDSWILEAGFARAPLGERRSRHGAVGAAVLSPLLRSCFGYSRALARDVAYVVGGHHGAIPDSGELIELRLDPLVVGQGLWEESREWLVRQLANLLSTPYELQMNLTLPVAMFVAGLTSVADWIGSIEQPFFPVINSPGHAPEEDLPAYFLRSRRQAHDALSELGWIVPRRLSPAAFQRLFPGIPKPNRLQEAAARLADNLAHERAALVIVEAPTGEGKTEAAWLLADRWGVAGGDRGVYVALPTQATSNQLFTRIRQFLEDRYDAQKREHVILQLLHGHAALSAEFQALQRRSVLSSLNPSVVSEEHGSPSAQRASSVMVAEWFTYRKRGLLAPFGVGTIDQALLSVLRVRHMFVRLFGLANRTVVIDEVHAYDTYMTSLMERLLEWLAALGSHVILLSATLPAERRQNLVSAYQRGLGLNSGNTVDESPAKPYPRLTYVTEHGTGSEHVPASPLNQRTLHLEWLDPSREREPVRTDRAGSTEPFGSDIGSRGGTTFLTAYLSRALQFGGCAAIICNTVRAAQNLYEELKPHFPGNASDGYPELELLHARYVYMDRLAREQRVLLRFGKPGGTATLSNGQTVNVRRPDRAIIISTQIIEQSLDLDADLMISELAPMDLLLQRAGRLHRHQRERRPPGLEHPRLVIITPKSDDEGRPVFGRAVEAVYHPHILLRTWLGLHERSTINIPDDVEDLISTVYDPMEVLPGLPTSVCEYWHRTAQDLEEAIRHDHNEARFRWLMPPGYRGRVWELTRNLKADDQPDFHKYNQALTRLAPPGITVIALYDSPSGPSFDVGGADTINLSYTPDLTTTARLLQRSVSLSDRRVLRGLQGIDVPSGWRRSALLRQCRPLLLDQAGRTKISGWTITFHPTLGVVIHEREAQDG